MALHRPAEFNKWHIPAFLADEKPRHYICVYPFVRSYDWYLLPDEDRRRMLAEHGKMARGYPDVRANTVAVVLARRLRVDPGLRGRRAVPHRRPHAPPARLRGAHARPRGGAVLHRSPGRHSRPRGDAALMGLRERLRAVFGRGDDDAPVVEPPVDRVARRAQLDRLEAALRTMARAMAALTAR